MENIKVNKILIKFNNSNFNYTLNVSADATKERCKDYFIGRYFNVDCYPKENYQRCIDIEYYKD